MDSDLEKFLNDDGFVITEDKIIAKCGLEFKYYIDNEKYPNDIFKNRGFWLEDQIICEKDTIRKFIVHHKNIAITIDKTVEDFSECFLTQKRYIQWFLFRFRFRRSEIKKMFECSYNSSGEYKTKRDYKESVEKDLLDLINIKENKARKLTSELEKTQTMINHLKRRLSDL